MGALRPPEPPLTDGVVTLRPFHEGDVEAIAEACQDPLTARFIPIPTPYGLDDARDYVTRTRIDWTDGTKAAFAVVAADDHGRLLGAVNVAIVGAAGNSGYWVHPDARGRGVATRALRLLTHWAVVELQLGVIILEIREENEASQRVARAAGYHLAGRIDVNDSTGEVDGLIFSHLATDPAAGSR